MDKTEALRDNFRDSIPDEARKYTPPTQDSIPAKNDPSELVKGQSLFEAFGYQFNFKVVGAGDVNSDTNFDKINLTFGEYTPTSEDQNRLFNPDNPAHSYINVTDQLAIFTYGVQIRYYKVRPIEEQTSFDDLYSEAPSREYEGMALTRDSFFAFIDEQSPLIVWGVYSSEDLSPKLTKYGMDTDNSAYVLVNISYIKQQLGRDPMIGDIVIPWDVPERVFEVRSVIPTNKTLYMPRRWRLDLELSQWSK